jgi:hypothetical protein
MGDGAKKKRFLRSGSEDMAKMRRGDEVGGEVARMRGDGRVGNSCSCVDLLARAKRGFRSLAVGC